MLDFELIVMKDIKTIIDARKALGATVTKKAQVSNLYVHEGVDGRFPVALTVTKDVPNMVQVSQTMIDAMNRRVQIAEKAHNDAVAANAENVDDLKAALEEIKVEAAKYVLDSWIEGKSTTVWTSNYDLNALLRQNPRTAFLAKKIGKFSEKDRELMEDMYFDIFCYADVDILHEKVIKDTMYCAPFSEKFTQVKNNNWYHTLFNFVLGEEGEATVRSMRKRHTDNLMAKADAAATKRSLNNDEDDSDD